MESVTLDKTGSIPVAVDVSSLRTTQVNVKQWSSDYAYIFESKWTRYIDKTTNARFTFFPLKTYGSAATSKEVTNKVKKLVNDMLAGRLFYVDEEQLDSFKIGLTRNRLFKLDVHFTDNDFLDHLRFSLSYRIDNRWSKVYIDTFISAVKHIMHKENTTSMDATVTAGVDNECGLNEDSLHHFKYINNNKTPGKPIFKSYCNKIAYLDKHADEDFVKKILTVGDTITGVVVRDMGSFEYILPTISGMLVEEFATKHITMMDTEKLLELDYTDRLVLNTIFSGSIYKYTLRLPNLIKISDELIESERAEKRFDKLLNALDVLYFKFNKETVTVDDSSQQADLPKPSGDTKRMGTTKAINNSAGNLEYTTSKSNTKPAATTLSAGCKVVNSQQNHSQAEIDAMLSVINATTDESVKSVLNARLKSLGYTNNETIKHRLTDLLEPEKRYTCTYDGKECRIITTHNATTDVTKIAVLITNEPITVVTNVKDIDFQKIESLSVAKKIWTK